VGCIRINHDAIKDIYGKVRVGTRVVVLPGTPPKTGPERHAAAAANPHRARHLQAGALKRFSHFRQERETAPSFSDSISGCR